MSRKEGGGGWALGLWGGTLRARRYLRLQIAICDQVLVEDEREERESGLLNKEGVGDGGLRDWGAVIFPRGSFRGVLLLLRRGGLWKRKAGDARARGEETPLRNLLPSRFATALIKSLLIIGRPPRAAPRMSCYRSNADFVSFLKKQSALT